MPRSDAMDRAIKKYEQEKVERIMFRVPKGMKEKIQDCAAKNGESVNGFLNRIVSEAIAKETD